MRAFMPEKTWNNCSGFGQWTGNGGEIRISFCNFFCSFLWQRLCQVSVFQEVLGTDKVRDNNAGSLNVVGHEIAIVIA